MKVSTRYVYLCFFFLSCCLVREAFAQEVTLRYGHVQGTSLTYKLTSDTPGLQASQKISLDIIREVVNVDAQEVMEINTTFNNGEVIMDGIPYPLSIQGQVLTAKQTRRGEAVSTTATGEFANMLSQVGLGTSSVSPDIFRSLGILEFPEQPVFVGDTWSVSKSHSFPNGDTLNITFLYTLQGFTSHAGYQCAQITLDAQPQISIYQDSPSLRRGMQMNGTLVISGTLLFAYTEGRIIKLDESVETSSVGITVGYDGAAAIVPVYQKTVITVELQ